MAIVLMPWSRSSIAPARTAINRALSPKFVLSKDQTHTRFSRLIKGGRSIPEPQYEIDEYYETTGFATTIDEAAKKATRYMIDYLVDTRGLSREQAYMLCSLAGDLKIAETVDTPHMLVTMHLPKRIFVEAGPKD